MPIQPITPEHQQPDGLTAPGEGFDVGWHGAIDRREMGDEQEGYEAPESEAAGAVSGFRGSGVDRDAHDEDEAFDREGGWQRPPEAKAHLRRAVDRDGQVRNVGDVVEHPMAEDGQAEDEGVSRPAAEQPVDGSEGDRPAEGGDQAVAVGVGGEIERIDRRHARDDPDLLPAEQEKRRPEKVEKLHGEKQRAERDRLRLPFGGETDCEVTDEHGAALRIDARTMNEA